MRVSIANRQRKSRLPLRRIEKDSLKALRLLGLQGAELSLVFASPRAVRDLNRRYRGIDSTTDVLSFPLLALKGKPELYASLAAGEQEEEPVQLGDVVIDPRRATEQAKEAGHPLGDEIARLVVHGLLHLLGYDHEGDINQKRRMRYMEKKVLGSL